MKLESNIEVFFSNGNTAIIKDSKQAVGLQKSWLLIFAVFLKDKRIDITEVKFRLPSG